MFPDLTLRCPIHGAVIEGPMHRILAMFALLSLVPCVGVRAHCVEQPLIVTACELKANPVAYNHKLVEVTSFVSYGFADFTLFDPSCPGSQEVWLEYAGTLSSGVMYCCGVTDVRSRPSERLKISRSP